MSSTEGLPLPVLFEDAHLLAVRKPTGLPVQPDPTGANDLLTLLRTTRRDPALEVVNRIDRPVSGVVLFARTARANSGMNALFRERRVDKRYLAIVEGALPPGEQVWDLEHVLRQDASARRARVNETGAQGSASSRIHVALLAQGDRYTLVEVRPQGGAFHQIRAQLSAWGHPIKGDVKYGARRGEKDRSIALHARSITFMHPITRVKVHIEAAPPTEGIWPPLLALSARG